MKKILPAFIVSVFFLQHGAFTQDIRWNTRPTKGFVFQINNAEAQRLLTSSPPDTYFYELLHTQVDTFDTRQGWTNRPPKGHFILAHISENKLHCEYISIFPYQVYLLKEYDALTLQVLDFDGSIREDAKVKFKLKRLRLDPESKTYRLANEAFYGESKFVTVELDGFRSVFNIIKHEAPTWYNTFYHDEGPDFYSYLITDKNRYKPNEKIRFKSYALSNNRTPLKKELDIWLSSGGRSIKAGTVLPHRPGSYAGEFALADSLKLTLDQSYNLRLTDRNGRIVSNCNFKYEDYELNGNKLEIQLATAKQFYPNSNRLSIVATDVNGLTLKGARASILVKTQTIRETFQPLVILPDTLMFREIDLNTDGAATVDIPSDIFQKTNTTYEVHVSVLNNQNQRIEKMRSAAHYYSQLELTTRFSNDSLVYEMLSNGAPIDNRPIVLRHNTEDKGHEVILPYKEKINPVVNIAYLTSPDISREIPLRSLTPTLKLNGGIEQDSFHIRLNNPQQLEVSWYIYQGGDLIQKGSGPDLEFSSLIVDRSRTYYVELLYSFGGEDHIKRTEYQFREGELRVSLDVPERVYPGQDVDATIQVSNQSGDPVSGVDLTALAVTGKLGYYLDDLPYYGTSSTPRSKRAAYSKETISNRSAILNLDYEKWKKAAGLDTMTYYRFLYPGDKVFHHSVHIPDSAQFTPYIMQNGDAKHIYVIEVDRVPVYYSWTDQPKARSFNIPVARKCQVTIRLHDRVLIFDSLSFERNKKTILSMDLDHLPGNVKVYKFNPTIMGKRRHRIAYHAFTDTEIKRHFQYVSAFKYTEGMASLVSGKRFIPLFNSHDRADKTAITVGPVIPGSQTYSAPPHGTTTTYQHTGGYMYAFENNIVYKLNAEKLIPERLAEYSENPLLTINDRVMTKEVFYQRPAVSQWHPRSIDISDYALRLTVTLPEENAKSGVAALLFENRNTKQVVSPCGTFNIHSGYYVIPRGSHNIILIYNNGTYLKMDDVALRSYVKIMIDLRNALLQDADSLSYNWLRSAGNNCYPSNEPVVTTYHHAGPIIGNIKGTVYDDTNTPLPGANVVIKGTSNGTVTNVDGTFALDADSQDVVLVVSFIGYQTKEIEVSIGSDVSLYLTADIQQLQEVVVTGYGVQTMSSLTGAISGRVAGVDITEPDVIAEASSVPDSEQSQAEAKLYQELLSLNTIRSHFSDVGFWEPKLFTDKHGTSSFRIHFPDDITRWEATVYAMNRRLQTGTTRKSIRSYKPIMAELNVPNFLTKGDSAYFLGKVSNYSDDREIKGKVKWAGPVTGEKEIQFTEFHANKFAVSAVTTDSITTSYTFTRDDGYLDGEERTIPVVEEGIVRADGSLSILNNNETFNVKPAADEHITVEIFANSIDVFAGEARYLLNYRYDCNEQLASKLIGLISYGMLMKFEGKPFKYDKDVNKIVARLLKNQNEGFLWSWWDVTPNTSYWMSAHILRALKIARDAGYQVNLQIENIARKAEYKFDIQRQYDIHDIDLLNALATWNAPLNYKHHVTILDSILLEKQKTVLKTKTRNPYPYSLLREKLMLLEIRQLTKLPYEHDSLLRYKKDGITGDMHFSDQKSASYWWNDELSANTVAYRIIKRDSFLTAYTTPMQLYFLSQRSGASWNTFHSSNVLATVLSDLVDQGATKKQQSMVRLSGKVNSTISKFPYRVELNTGDALSVHKESGLPVYYMQYREERVTEAKTGVEGFMIKTTLPNNGTLEAGKPVTINVQVTVTKDAAQQYVMIEVPIPASCSYVDKSQRYHVVETHREYFKEKTLIFCENMRPGTYNFGIELLPRFTGAYGINPAQVSLMYLPVVNANTDMKRVIVK